MATSHGGILYYVVQVPKEETTQEKWTATTKYLEEKQIVTSTPKQSDKSTDSGWDNPFRPDGDLSREADEIVELIKGGKPITPTPGSVAPKLPSVEDNSTVTPQTASPVSQSPVKGANGNTVLSNNKSQASPPGAVELQRATVVPPSDASHVQHVVLKKKPKCKCCVIQ
uniref:Uncharacterized protein n=1 Tax=Clastoptera arizonana TaxID=38151 RepID=A0A1B6DUF5_9HEMI